MLFGRGNNGVKCEVARFQNPPQHRECTCVGNAGLKKKKKKKLIARVGIRGHTLILYEQKEKFFEELVAILNDKNKFGP